MSLEKNIGDYRVQALASTASGPVDRLLITSPRQIHNNVVSLSRSEAADLWRAIGEFLSPTGEDWRSVPETTYSVGICEACGKAELIIGSGDAAVAAGSNYPKCCGAGGAKFVQQRRVARRRMTIEWFAER